MEWSQLSYRHPRDRIQTRIRYMLAPIENAPESPNPHHEESPSGSQADETRAKRIDRLESMTYEWRTGWKTVFLGSQ